MSGTTQIWHGRKNMKLYFENRFGEKRLLGKYKTEKGAIRRINRFCDEHNFKIYYMRITETEEYKWYDVGSHSEFFYLYKEGFDPKNGAQHRKT